MGSFSFAASAAGFVALSSVLASGQTIRVEIWAGGGSPVVTRTYPSGAPISDLPALPAGVTRINVYSVGGAADIGRITFGFNPVNPANADSSSTEFDLVIGQGAPPTGPSVPSAARNFAGIGGTATIASRVRLSGGISGNVTSKVSVGRVARLNVAGGVLAGIEASGADDAIGYLTVGQVLLANNKSVGADSIAAPNGRINAIVTPGAIDIGSPGAISAKHGIGEITAQRIKGRIAANAFGGDGDLAHVYCVGGDFDGSIAMNNLRGTIDAMPETMIYVSGVMRGLVDISGDLYGGVSIDGLDPSTGVSVGEVKIAGDMYGIIDAPGNIGPISIGGGIRIDTNSFSVPAIRSRQGTIGTLHIGGGVEGLPGLPSLLQAASFGQIFIGGDCNGTISAWPTGYCVIGSLDIGGSLINQIFMRDFGSFKVRGDTLAGSQIWKHGPLQPNQTISIGNSHFGQIIIDEPNGLAGQIIFNANAGGASGWGVGGLVALAQAHGDPRLFTQREYQRNTAPIGGGAIGVAPFNVRGRESLPQPFAVVNRTPHRVWPGAAGDRETVVMTFDGPVTSQTDQVLMIERASSATSCPPGEPCIPEFKPVTDVFDVLVAPPNHPREVWISPKSRFAGGVGTFGGGQWIYRVTPRTDEFTTILKSAQTNTVAPVSQFSYSFIVDSFDITQDRRLTPDDAVAWITAPADVDGDDAVDGNDLSTLITAIAEQ